MKITRKTITENEFLNMKRMEPFKTMRQDGKTVNFSYIFGASYMRFSEGFLEVAWDEKRIDKFIADNNLEDDLADMTEKWKLRDVNPILYKYYTVANYIRNKFFETYPGLMTRL